MLSIYKLHGCQVLNNCYLFACYLFVHEKQSNTYSVLLQGSHQCYCLVNNTQPFLSVRALMYVHVSAGVCHVTISHRQVIRQQHPALRQAHSTAVATHQMRT